MRSHYTQQRSEGATTDAAMWSTVAAMLDLDIDSEELTVARFGHSSRRVASYREALRIVQRWQQYRSERPVGIKRSILGLRKSRALASQRKRNNAAHAAQQAHTRR